jgi:Right handed beta helix region
MHIRQRLQHLGYLICGLLLLGGVWAAPASAATYYLSPTGSNTNAGTSPSAPWKTFAHAIPKLKPGDTLVLRPGTYTSSNSGYPHITCGSNASNGTAAQPITLKAASERQAFLSGNGTVTPFRMVNCSYWTVEGLRLRSADAQGSPVSGTPAVADNVANVTLKRLLITHNNRYQNSHLLSLKNSSHVLVEESEFYSFHRHAILVYHTNNSTFRRNYFNSRGHADIAGGRSSGTASRGDDAIVIYPGSSNIVENNISEGIGVGFSIQADGTADNNQLFGNISLNDHYGVTVRARGATGSKMPHNTVIKDFVAINSSSVGVYARSAKNTRCVNCSFLGGASGLIADKDSGHPGDGTYSFYADNTLVMNARSNGIKITNQSAWGLGYPNTYQNRLNVSVPTDVHITNERSVDPQLGACKVWIPATSPLKGAGKNGADIGASVLYRYQNGVLTTQPLWEVATGKFPCGAVLAGVNDVVGASCGDVHKRLNVQANGCTPPSGYGHSSLTAPSNLRIAEGQ